MKSPATRFMQTSTWNNGYHFGSTPNGIFNTEGQLVRANTIGAYGCKFTAAVNIGNTISRDYNYKQVGRPLIANVGSLCGNDKYFEYYMHDYSSTVAGREDWVMESDANMSDSQMVSLLSDITGLSTAKFSVSRYRGTSMVNTMVDWYGVCSENVYGLAQVTVGSNKHFINLYYDEKKGMLEFHDPYGRWTQEQQKLIKEKINSRDFELVIIHVE